MTEPRQKIMGAIGREGCYMLCIVRAAERITGKRIDAVKVYLDAIERKQMEPDCYLLDPAAILSDLTGIKWKARHDSIVYKPDSSQVMIMRYERKGTGVSFSHFVLCDGAGAVEYDPYGDSSTVRGGKPVSSRVFSHV
jgi:hypothetical protein